MLLAWSCNDQKVTVGDVYELGTKERSLSAKIDTSKTTEFVDVAANVGVDFTHTSGRSGRKYGVETIGSGAVFFDFDGDGWMDLYAVNGAPLPGYVGNAGVGNALYHNESGVFSEVGLQLGVADSTYGMGAVSGDYDNDGDSDLFVSNFGENVLFRNDDTLFVDKTDLIEGNDDSWSTGCAFFDYDLDGDLDLYVANYLDYTFELSEFDENGELRRPRRHLAPTEYSGRRDFFYRNDEGFFIDVTQELGFISEHGRELGVVFFDADLDGDLDMFQGNDATPNFLYRNDGGFFAETGLWAGVAYNDAGKPEGTMGVDIADYDSDGLPDVVVTNFQWESNTLYRNIGNGRFRDVSADAGIAVSSLDRLAFGINFFDYDNDGDEDLYVVNGHIDEDIERFDPQARYPQRDQLYRNESDGTFVEISEDAGTGLKIERVGRGSAVADYDNDGDLDIYVLNTAGVAMLLQNNTSPIGDWLQVSLSGTVSNPDAYGARVEVWQQGKASVRYKRSSASYLSQNDPRLHFGLGYQAVDSLVVYWPNNRRQRVNSDIDSNVITILESKDTGSNDVFPPSVSVGDNFELDVELQSFWKRAPLMLPEKVNEDLFKPDLELLRAGVESEPTNLQARISLIQGLIAHRAYSLADSQLVIAQNIDYESAELSMIQGRLRSDLGDVNGAVNALERAVILSKDLAEPYYLLGNLRVRQQQLKNAVQCYEHAIARDRKHLKSYYNLAGLHARQTDYGLAISVLEKGLQELPEEVELFVQMANVHFIRADYNRALVLLEKIIDTQPDRADAYDMVAQIYINQNDFQAASKILRRGLKNRPNNPLLMARMGVSLVQTGMYEEAISHLEKAMKKNPDRSEVYYNLGQALTQSGYRSRGKQVLDYFRRLQTSHEEILEYKTAIVLNPRDALAYYRLGVIYAKIERYAAAIQAYSAVLQILPNHVDALNNVGNIYLREKDVDRAIRAYMRVLKIDPQYARAHHNLGNAHVLLGEVESAIRAFRLAIEMDSSYVAPKSMLKKLYELGYSNAKLNSISEGVEELSKASTEQ
ncbi:MAG: tetratricopeptide repeat protein [Candidatus Latescibacterota bacterium]|nr:tetratricopeptide repeat protein [Candidatus Latescibacterota bacterium]